MKIKTTRGEIRNVSIQKRKNGVIAIFSEETTGIVDAAQLKKAIANGSVGGTKGRVVLATKYEIDLLKNATPPDITISDDFIATDVYEAYDHVKKSRFWMSRDDSITIDPANTGHLVNGMGPVDFKPLLAKHNAK